jgi:hypothetical protein
MHAMHGNGGPPGPRMCRYGVAPPPGLELAATRSHRNTVRRRTLRRMQCDKLSSAMFIVDLQFRTMRNAMHELQEKVETSSGEAACRIYSRGAMLAAREETGAAMRSDEKQREPVLVVPCYHAPWAVVSGWIEKGASAIAIQSWWRRALTHRRCVAARREETRKALEQRAAVLCIQAVSRANVARQCLAKISTQTQEELELFERRRSGWIEKGASAIAIQSWWRRALTHRR